MKIILLALTFLLVQIVSPLPRQRAENSANSSDRGTNKTDPHKNPTAEALAATNATSTKGEQRNSDSVAAEHKQTAFAVVATLPRKDGWDIAYILATWALVLVGGITLAAIWRQTTLMGQNLVFQFRPKLIVRQMFLEVGTIQTPGAKPSTIRYTVANIGGTAARIVRIHGAVDYVNVPGTVGRTHSPLTPSTCSQKFDLQESTSFGAGEDRKLTLELDQNVSDKIRFLQMQCEAGVTNPQIVGEISIRAELLYSDEIRIKRKTGILRSLDVESRRFTPSEDKEYEYVD